MKKNRLLSILLVLAVVFISMSPKATAQTNKIKGSEVVVIGDSFLAMSHDITKRLRNMPREEF